MRRGFKWAGLGLGFVALAVAAVLVFEAAAYDRHARAAVPVGYARNSSLYVPGSDGTRIAVDVWLPADLAAGARVPALIKATPYWRRQELTLVGKAVAELFMPDFGIDSDVPALNARGYAVVVADVRGTGASFGTIDIMFGGAEVADYGSIVEWIVAQPWSSGSVGAYGFSYRGISAANIASLANPAIKAVAPLFDLPDLYLLTYPGGAFESYLLTAWGAQTRQLNDGVVPCAGNRICQLMIRGPKPVDADGDRVLLRQAIREHEDNWNVHDCVRAAPARDDKICRSGSTLDGVSVLARKPAIEQRGLPMFVLTGWLDESSPAQVLHRYRTFSNPQQVVIGPFTHGGFMGDDPFAPDRPLDMPYRRQTQLMADFFDRYLKPGGAPIAKGIRYYVNGAALWRDTATWPPPGATPRRWYLATPGGLDDDAARAASGADRYVVDFSATTGALSRYRGQVDLSKTDYGDRAAADKRLLVYETAPLAADMEIAGDPVAHLRLSSSADDGLVIVYLEDVAPAGRVTYVTEGVLRLAFRKRADGAWAARTSDPFHSYLKADMAPMAKGAWQDVDVAIAPIAALIRAGHRLRVAVAGVDAGNLERLPATGEAALSVERGGHSWVEVPAMR